MASCSDEQEAETDLSMWKCPLCLDKYKNPKLLPCSHTFCKDCLSDLLQHQKGRIRTEFDCPSCRERIRVPSGGVNAFKTNYYLEAARPKEKRQLLCKVHASKPREMELFCRQCNTCICLKCKLDDHYDHHTVSIEEMSKEMKAQLSNDVFGLTSTISGLKRKLDSFSEERKAVREKKEAVEKDIVERHRMMMTVADKCRNDALFSLDTVTASIESELEGAVNKMQKSLDTLDKLKKRMEKCQKGEDGSGLMATAQDIYQEASQHEEEVQQMLMTQISTVSRPVLRFTTTADVTLSSERNFLGGVEKLDIPVGGTEVTVRLLFKSATAREAHGVYSLFPRIDDKVWIVYEVCGLNENTAARHPQLLTLTGEVVETEGSVKGRTNFTHTNEGSGMCIIQTSGSFQTYAKSRSLMRLKNLLNGTGEVLEVAIKNENPLKTSAELRFRIRCGPHRAFDVHENKKLCAVVEEAPFPESQRRVHVYQQPRDSPAATYWSPIQPFQPSDVCFYKLGGRHVLLVADEVNDAIHVVRLENGQLECGGFLAAGHPLIIQPMALNTDFKGRLWIACRSGAVLLCQQGPMGMPGGLSA